MLTRPSAAAACRRFLGTRRVLSTPAPEFPSVIDPFTIKPSIIDSWRDWVTSTLAVVQLRQTTDFTVPRLREEAAQIFCDVGDALARRDKRRLKQLTTPMCYSSMEKALQVRPSGEVHQYRAVEASANVKQFRIGHLASDSTRRFAQATCLINAKVVWEIKDAEGQRIGGVGTEDEPHQLSDLWVFERCISGDNSEVMSWRLKLRRS